MKSPFPGMDPFIEACGLWEDFHSHLIEMIGERLAEAVPDRYLVRVGERSYVVLVESEGKVRRPFKPDVGILTRGGRKKSAKKGGAALAEHPASVQPIMMRPFVEEEHREALVEIYSSAHPQRLVTSLEVLSPSNKRPGTPGWDLYQRKRQSLLLGGVNLVEIELLRSGERMPMLDPWPDSPYTLLVTQPQKNLLSKVWPVYFHSPLPPLPVPLTKPDPDVLLDLQQFIEAIYRRYRYEQSIDYRKPLTPPLQPDEAAWLKKQLRSAKV